MDFLPVMHQLADNGWSSKVTSQKMSSGFIRLEDGRLAEVQVTVETKQDNFLAQKPLEETGQPLV